MDKAERTAERMPAPSGEPAYDTEEDTDDPRTAGGTAGGGDGVGPGAGASGAGGAVRRPSLRYLSAGFLQAGPDTRGYAFVTGAAYGVLAILGAIFGLIGSFNYSWTAAGVPVAALVLIGFNLGAFLLAGRGMGGKLGALVPAAAWMLVVVVMQTRRPEGDLPITGTIDGYLFIVGGMVAAGLAIVVTPSSGPAGAWLVGRGEGDSRVR